MSLKDNRLRKKKDIEKVFKAGKNFKEGPLVLKFLEKEDGGNRYGFVVSGKVSKKAAERNRLKRRLRELVKGKIKKPRLDVLLISLPGLEKLDFKELEAVADKLFKKAKING